MRVGRNHRANEEDVPSSRTAFPAKRRLGLLGVVIAVAWAVAILIEEETTFESSPPFGVRQRALQNHVTPEFQWYGRSTTPAYPSNQRSWSDAVTFCTAQGKRLCQRDEYCTDGPNGKEIAGGGVRSGESWAPAGDGPHTWVQVGVWNGVDAGVTCQTHEEAFDSTPDDRWATGMDIKYHQWIACCSDIVAPHDQLSPEIRSNYDDDKELPGATVFSTGPWVPEELVASNLAANPNLKFQHFTDKAMARSAYEISLELEDEAGVTGAWEAWKALRPWAFRADLWRYMILWSKGGMYLDSKIKLVEPIGSWAALSDGESVAVCQDHELSWHSEKLDKDVHFLWNGAMSGRRRSPVLLEAIRMAIGTIQARGYALITEESSLKKCVSWYSTFSITGPALLGYAAADVAKRKPDVPGSGVRVPCKFLGNNAGLFMTGTETKVMEIESSEHNKVHESSTDYGSLYKAGHLYCDGEAQPSNEKALKSCNLESFLSKEELE